MTNLRTQFSAHRIAKYKNAPNRVPFMRRQSTLVWAAGWRILSRPDALEAPVPHQSGNSMTLYVENVL